MVTSRAAMKNPEIVKFHRVDLSLARRMSKDIYAFVSWIASIAVYVIFLLWAFPSESLLHTFGLTYYPSKYWAIALPSYIITSAILAGIGYIGLNLTRTFEPTDIRTVLEPGSKVERCNQYIKCGIKEGTYLLLA